MPEQAQLPLPPCDGCGRHAHLLTVEPPLGGSRDLCRACRADYLDDLLTTEGDGHA